MILLSPVIRRPEDYQPNHSRSESPDTIHATPLVIDCGGYRLSDVLLPTSEYTQLRKMLKNQANPFEDLTSVKITIYSDQPVSAKNSSVLGKCHLFSMRVGPVLQTAPATYTQREGLKTLHPSPRRGAARKKSSQGPRRDGRLPPSATLVFGHNRPRGPWHHLPVLVQELWRQSMGGGPADGPCAVRCAT